MKNLWGFHLRQLPEGEVGADSLGLSYDWIETDIMAGQSRTAAYLAMNPAGQVPAVILDDGRPLAQSNAIILHLAEGSALIPKDAYERARMLEWMFWEQYSHEPYVAVARFQVRYLGKAVADLEPRIVERGNGALQRLEDGLADRSFLAAARSASQMWPWSPTPASPTRAASTWPAIRGCGPGSRGSKRR